MTANGIQRLAPSTGLFLITNLEQISRYRQLLDKVQNVYNVEPLPKWNVEYKLYHSRPETAKVKGAPPDLQHILHLSHARSHFFIALDKPEDEAASSVRMTSKDASDASKTETSDHKPALSNPEDLQDTAMTATATTPLSPSKSAQSSDHKVPAQEEQPEPLFIVKVAESQKDATLAILAQKMALLWTPRIFLNLTGVSFKVMDSHVRIGEVRSGTSSSVRALMVAIEVASVVTDEKNQVARDEQERVRWEVGTIRREIGLVDFTRDAWGFGSDQSVVGAWCDIMKLK